MRLPSATAVLRPLLSRHPVWWLATAGAIAAVVGAGAWHRERVARTGMVLSSSGAFTISGSVRGLEPGVGSTLALTVSNPQSTPLTLSSVAASLASTQTAAGQAAPAACATYLSPALPHSWTAWSGATVVPPATGSAPGTVQISVPLSFADSGTDQDACQGVTYNLSYTGAAYYTDPTSTSLTVNPNPAAAGAPVTLTATVSSTDSGQTPTGSVTFTGPGGTALGAPVALNGSGQTTLTTTALPSGSDAIIAAYSPTGTHNGGADFFSSSGTANATVSASCATAPTSGATQTITGTYAGNYTVVAGKSLWLDGGAITGNVVVSAGGQLAGTGGTIDGNLTAQGTSALQGTTVDGNVQATGAALAMSGSAVVRGNVQASGSGPLCLNAVAVSGNVAAQALTSSTPGWICQTSAGNIVVQADSEPLRLGGQSSCAGDTVSGNLTVQANSGALTIGAASYGTRVAGNIVVQSNTGGGTIAGNTVTGGTCTLSGDKPGIVGSGNTVPAHNANTCNGTA